MIIKLTRDNYDFKFRQYEGMYFHADVQENNDKNNDKIRYKITKDEKGEDLKEFGNTHIKDNMIFIPCIDAYIDLNNIKVK